VKNNLKDKLNRFGVKTDTENKLRLSGYMFPRAAILVLMCIANIIFSGFLQSAFGGAFDNPTFGIRAVGTGFAPTGVAASDASAVFFNPATMVFNQNDTLYAEVYAYYAPTDFQYTENSVTDKSDETFLIPGFFISKRFDNWAVGFGSYIPYAGGGTAYDDFQNTGFDLESFAGWFAFTPAVAYKFGETFSVGAGVSLYMGEMEEKLSIGGLKVESEYDGFAGYGGHIGFLYKPTDEFGIGFTARSEVSIEMDGEVKMAGFKFDSEVELTFPYSFTLGFGYEPAPNLTLGFSSSYMLWDHMDEITVKTDGQMPVDNPTGYKNNWVLGLGMEYRPEGRFTFRSGLKFDQGATKKKYLHARSNDVDKLTPGIGIAYDITETIELNIAGLVVFGFEEEYGSKKFDQDNYAILLGFRYKAQ
jgi:long-chain fatty acid transport protein